MKESVANRKDFDRLFPKDYAFPYDMDDASPKALKSLIRWEQRLESAREGIAEFEDFVSSLSGIDGAVVLTKKLRVIGFGAEIIAYSPSLTTVGVAADPKGKTC